MRKKTILRLRQLWTFLVLLVATGMFAVPKAEAKTILFTIDHQDIVFDGNTYSGYRSDEVEGPALGTYTDADEFYIQGHSSQQHTVTVKNGAKVKITLQGVEITIKDAAPFQIIENSTVYLYLTGNSTLINTHTLYDSNAGLYVEKGSTVEISGKDKEASLTAHGGHASAGIGANNNTPTGKIIIDSGIISAMSGSSGEGAGIGLGFLCPDDNPGEIIINGGTIVSTIGGAYMRPGPAITITGGIITAINITKAPAIGSGLNGTCPKLTITGGTISATNDYSFNSTIRANIVTITGGSIKTNGGIANPKNAEGNPVYLNALSSAPASKPVNEILFDCYCDTYGVNDVETDAEGKLYLYLEETEGVNKTILANIDGEKYTAYYVRPSAAVSHTLMETAIGPELISYPKLHKYDEEITRIEFCLDFSMTDWSINGDATITVRGNDQETVKKEFILKINTEGPNYKNALIPLEIPFNSTDFIKEYSQLDNDDPLEYAPAYYVEISIPLKNGQGGLTVLEETYPLRILYPKKPLIRTVSKEIQPVYKEGVKDILTYEVTRLDREGPYEISYEVINKEAANIANGIVTYNDRININKQTYRSTDGTLPDWLMIKETEEKLSNSADLTISYEPADPTTTYDYTEVRITVKNIDPDFSILSTTETKRVSPTPNLLKANYKSPTSPDFLSLADNWEQQGIRSADLAGLANDSYNSDHIYQTFLEKLPSKVFSITAEEQGDGIVTVTGANNETYSISIEEINTFRVDYPLNGGSYDITIEWAKTGNKLEYSYSFDNINGKLYTYNVAGYDTSKDLFIEYTNGKGNYVFKTVTCTKGKLILSDSDSINGTIHLRGVKPGSSSEYVYATIASPQIYGTGSVLYNKTNEFKEPINGAIIQLIPQKDFKIRLYNKDGEAVTTNARINYFSLDKDKKWLDNSEGRQEIDRLFAFPLKDNTILDGVSNTMYVEIIADGYLPQIIRCDRAAYEKSNNVSVILKQYNRGTGDRYANLSLLQEEKWFDFTNLSSNERIDYVSYITAGLNAWINLGKGTKQASANEFSLTGTDAKETKAASCVLYTPEKYKALEYSYAELQFDIKNFLPEQKSTYPFIKKGGQTVTEVPILQNLTKSTEDIKKLLEKLVVLPIPENVDDLTGVKDDAGEYIGEAFDKFDLTLPSLLPLTFQVTKDGNEFQLKGIASFNLLPIPDAVDKWANNVEYLQDFATMFDQVVSEVNNEKGYFDSVTNSYKFNSAFVGVRVYATGKATYIPEKDTFKIDFVDVGAKMELSGAIHSSLKYPMIGKFGYGLEGELSTAFSIEKPNEDDLITGDYWWKQNLVLTNKLALDIYVNAAVGGDIWLAGAYVGVIGGGGVEHTQKIVFKPYATENTKVGIRTDLNAYIEVYAEAYFLFWSVRESGKIVDASKVFLYPDDNTNPLKSTHSTQISKIGNIYKRSTLNSSNAIISDISASARPLYLDNGKKVAFTNIGNAGDYNDDRIQIYSGGAPSNISKSENSAFSFSASSAGGKDLISYERLSEQIVGEISMDKLTELSSKLEVIGAIGNSGAWSETVLSKSGFANMQPKSALSADGSKGVVVWTTGQLKKKEESENAFDLYMEGDLVMSRYDGSSWSTVNDLVSLLNIDRNTILSDFNVAIAADGTVTIVAARKTNASDEDMGGIFIITIDNANQVKVAETNFKGINPQIKPTTNGNYILSFLTNNPDSEKQDIYFMTVDKNGNASGVSGYAGLESKLSYNYTLVANETPTSLYDFSLVWTGSTINSVNNSVITDVYAAKLGYHNENGLYASQPVSVLTAPDGYQPYFSDAYMDGNKMKVATLLTNSNSGAEIVENQFEYKNVISSAGESYAGSQVQAGSPLKVRFLIENKGFLPVKSVKLKIGNDPDVNFEELLIMPDAYGALEASYNVPQNVVGDVNYTVEATFEDNSTSSFNAGFSLKNVDLAVKLLSLTPATQTSNEKNKVIIEVSNNSPFSLENTEKIIVGIYEDIKGEELYAGTTPIEIPVTDLYDETEGNLKTAITFDLDQVVESVSLYAVVKTPETNDQDLMNNSTVITLTTVRQSENPGIPINYLSVTLSESEGVMTNPLAGSYFVAEQGEFKFTASLDSKHQKDTLVVTTDRPGEGELTPNADGQYTVSDIREKINVKIALKPYKDPVGNEALTDGIKVWAASGKLYISLDKKQEVVIHNALGQLVYKGTLPAGDTVKEFAKGVYLVTIGTDFIQKVQL